LRQPIGLESQLIDRGVTALSAAQLVREHVADVIQAKLAVFDELRKAGDRRVSRNPAGYLVKSIRENYTQPVGILGRACRPSPETAIPVRAGIKREVQREVAAIRESESERRIDQYLSTLSAEERSELESAAVSRARGLPADGLRRSVASGKGMVAAHYRQVIVRQHVQRLLDQQAAA
jgi:hypothetical protein